MHQPNKSHSDFDCNVRTFVVDVTPPVGDYLCGGFHDTSIGIETPLHLRGLIVSANSTRYVLASVDYCYLRGKSHQRFVEALARGAGVDHRQVVLHSNHVHDAPLIDEEGHALVERYNPDIVLHNEEYFSKVLGDSSRAIESALAKPAVAVSGIAFSSHKVESYASRRPVIDDNGQCQVRFSICNDPEIRNRPEGLIDPFLDQINFYGLDSRPVVSMNFYASHPQVSNGRGLISSDAIGVAIESFEKHNPDVFTLYFTGCGGNVTAGKYSTTDRERNRVVFGDRLFNAMQSAFEKSIAEKLISLDWKDEVRPLSLCRIPQDSHHFEKLLQGSEPTAAKYLAAMKLHRLNHGISTYPFRISRLTINDINVLFLPSELCVEYQLYAKSQSQGRLTAAAYGDSFLNYVATAPAFEEGGYEVRPQWTEVDQSAENQIKAHVDHIIDSRVVANADSAEDGLVCR